MTFARGLPRAQADRFVGMYVNDWTRELGPRGREAVARFLGAGSRDEIVFVRGTTEGINLIAQSWGRRHIGPEDEIVITWLEHHANIVPWQQLCAEKGARLRVAPR